MARESIARGCLGVKAKGEPETPTANRRTYVMTRTELKQIKILDTTLRDGENRQAPR